MDAKPTETVPGSSPPARPARLRRALDTLGVKLFLAIAGANLVLVMAVYLGYSWSFDKGLVEYVNDFERERLAPLTARLADGYQQHGSWRWLQQNDNDQWKVLAREILGFRGAPRDAGARDQPSRTQGSREQNAKEEGTKEQGSKEQKPQQGDRAATQRTSAPAEASGSSAGLRPERLYMRDLSNVMPPTTVDYWRIALLDASGNAVIPYFFQDARMLEQSARLPITVNGAIVGYLGYIPRLGLVEWAESITARQQSMRLVAIAIGMLAAVLLNAALISHWLSRRLRALGYGAAALARGDYSTRIPARGHDEVARLAGDFNHLAQALEAAQRGRQQWIADIAHELRTPLTSLRAEVEAVQDGVRPLTQSSIASVAQEVHQLTRLVEDLRLLSLSDLGALTCRKEPVQLAEIVDDALAASRASISEKGLEVRTSMDASLVVDVDADRLAQVFANLLQNTLRYTEAPGRLSITAVADGGSARIQWEDSSPGVGDVDLHRLTERLYRLDESRARVSGGSGLGLAIVKAIIDAHGGRMQASHSPLGGLRWSIWLPLSES